MKPVFQISGHDPERGIFGDCTRAAYASILELEAEKVPHFFFDGCSGSEGAKRIEAFLKPMQLHRLVLATQQTVGEFLDYMGKMNPDLYWILGCSSTTADHSVVCLGGDVVHDPAQKRVGQYGKSESGWLYAEILVPLMTVASAGRVEQGKEQGT